MEPPMAAEFTELVHRYYTAYGTKDRQAVEDLLGDGFSFSSPHDNHIDHAAYFAKCWPNSGNIRGIEIERLCQSGPEVFVRYRLETLDGGQFRNVEVIRFEGSKIAEVDVYFGRTISRTV
jgi:SnoaL-like domain